MTTFRDFPLNSNIQRALEEKEFTTPTEIQEKVIPQILESTQDIIALAQTGTGKTAAFSLPVLSKMDLKKKHVQTLVLSPTRELAMQIAKDIKGFAKHMNNFNVVAVYGGSSIQDQMRSIRRGAHVIVGTPGRMLDLLKRKVLQLDKVQWVILDEADEMLKMGFVEDITSILSTTPDDKQTLLFSATMSRTIEQIAKKYMHNSMRIEAKATAHNKLAIDHQFMMVPARDKLTAFKRYRALHPDMYGIVFCRTRRETQEFGDALLKEGYPTGVLHGEIEQKHRTHIMESFKRKNISLLVATDVAARGIDVAKLTHVIHVGVPDYVESYVHRSGRTGRANEKGISLVIAHLREHRALYRIEQINKIKFEEIKVPKRQDLIKAEVDRYVSIIEAEGGISKLAEKHVDEMLENVSAEDMILVAKKALSVAIEVIIRKYPEENLDKPGGLGGSRGRGDSRDSRGGYGGRDDRGGRRNDRSGGRSNNYSDRSRGSSDGFRGRNQSRGNEGMETLVISLGRKHSLKVPHLLGMINEVTQGQRVDIGDINLGERESSFEVPADFVGQLSKSMSRLQFKDQRVRVKIGTQVARTADHSSRAPMKRKGRGKSTGGFKGKTRKRF
jgi:ATP-dependent RNA helicase DeaD